MLLDIIRIGKPFQKAIPESIQKIHPLDSLSRSLIGKAEPLSMIQNKEFFIEIRLIATVKEATQVEVWKRKITN